MNRFIYVVIMLRMCISCNKNFKRPQTSYTQFVGTLGRSVRLPYRMAKALQTMNIFRTLRPSVPTSMLDRIDVFESACRAIADIHYKNKKAEVALSSYSYDFGV